jgi:hypothetical protein
MRALTLWLAALTVLAATADPTQAYYPYYYPCGPQAPDACGPGYYITNSFGAQYGPNYWVYPPYPPFNGARPSFQKQQQNAQPSFPTHPFARGPRDYFMLEP